MSANDKFLVLAAVLFALLIVYRTAPVAAVLTLLALLALAYVTVDGDRRR